MMEGDESVTFPPLSSDRHPSAGNPAARSATAPSHTGQAISAQYYQPAAHLKVLVIPGTGHDLALSTTAPLTDAAMIGWSLSVIAP
jgi:hypothetical protein